MRNEQLGMKVAAHNSYRAAKIKELYPYILTALYNLMRRTTIPHSSFLIPNYFYFVSQPMTLS